MSYERDVIGGWSVFVGLWGLVLLLVLAWAIPTWLQSDLTERREDRMPAANPLAKYGRTVPPIPRLQVNPDRDIATYRAAQEARLRGYGWVDRSEGVVHIPVDRAMELLVERKTSGDRGGKR